MNAQGMTAIIDQRYLISGRGDSGQQLVPMSHLAKLRCQLGLSSRMWLLPGVSCADTTASATLSPLFIRQYMSSVPEAVSMSDGDIASARGLPRLRLLWKTDPIGAGSIVAGMLGVVYLIVHGIVSIWPVITSSLSMAAHAQEQARNLTVNGRSGQDDPLDWIIVSFMGVVLIFSMIVALWGKDQKRISFGMDLTKMIMGFVVGFLGGKAHR